MMMLVSVAAIRFVQTLEFSGSSHSLESSDRNFEYLLQDFIVEGVRNYYRGMNSLFII